MLFLPFLIGVITGLRSLTAPALVAWVAHSGWLHLQNTPLFFMGSTAAVIVFTLLAIGELIADQDLVIALLEDAVAIGAGLAIVSGGFA